jgi:HK97 family phage major capsid protein
MKKNYAKMREGVENTIATLRKKITNAITDDARAEIEGHIAELQQAADALRELESAAEAGEDDNSETMRAQMREVLDRLSRVEDGLKKQPAVNAKKINNGRAWEKKFHDMVLNSLNRDEFKTNLKKLAVENSITITDGDISALLPAAVLNEVNDVFVNHRHRLLEVVDWTGLPVFKAFYETGEELGHHWPSAMLGETASTDPKTQQNLTFDELVIRPAFEYKTLALDKEIIKASEGDGSVFIRYIVRELLDRLLTHIEVMILTGNGKNFLAPAAETLQVDANSNPKYHAINYMPYNEGLVAVVTRSFYADLLQKVQTQSNYLVVADADNVIRNILGVDEVIMTPPTFTTTGNQIGLFFLNPRAYKMVGDRRPDQYEDFNLEWNRVEYLMEMWVGGGCVTPEFIAMETGE